MIFPCISRSNLYTSHFRNMYYVSWDWSFYVTEKNQTCKFYYVLLTFLRRIYSYLFDNGSRTICISLLDVLKPWFYMGSKNSRSTIFAFLNLSKKNRLSLQMLLQVHEIVYRLWSKRGYKLHIHFYQVWKTKFTSWKVSIFGDFWSVFFHI